MIKDISHDERHFLQTRFGILIYLYLTGRLNIVPWVDQIAFCSKFENAPNKTIILNSLAAKVRTNNKVAPFCICKKFTTQSFNINAKSKS